MRVASEESMSDRFRLDTIGQIHIGVDDCERAVAFYRDVLGMRFLFDVPAQSMAFFDCGGIRLYLGKVESAEIRSNPLIYYRVADIHEAHAALQARGVVFLGQPHAIHRTDTHELWLAGFRDSEGNYLHLMSEAPLNERREG
jgi:methylmalonyl-CoA/ethylmalonyl-CoA epimerase